MDFPKFQKLSFFNFMFLCLLYVLDTFRPNIQGSSYLYFVYGGLTIYDLILLAFKKFIKK